jgi:hypothetical protein
MRRRRVVGVDLCRITHLCQDLPPSPLPFIRPSDVCAAAISEPRAWRQGAKLPPTTATAGSTCGLRRQSSAQSQHAPTLQWSRQHERNLPVDPPRVQRPWPLPLNSSQHTRPTAPLEGGGPGLGRFRATPRRRPPARPNFQERS